MQQDKPSASHVPTKNPVRHLSWKLAPVITIAALFVPIIVAILLIQLTGAHLLDGLFGVYRNTSAQATAVSVAMMLVLVAPVLSVGFSIYFAGIRADLPMRKRLLPLAFTIPIILLIVLHLFGAFFRQ